MDKSAADIFESLYLESLKPEMKMKIAYFLDVPVGLGGAGNLLLQRAKLISEIYEVIVIIPCDENKICNEEYALRCNKYGLKYKSILYNTSYDFYDIDILGAYENYREVEKVIIDEKVTFLHSVQLNIVAEMVSRNLNIPHLMDIYQIDESEFKICRDDIFAHYHLCDSLLYSNMWKTNLKIMSKCIRPVAPLKEIAKKEVYPTEKFKILILGNVCEIKNQLTAIKAIERGLSKYDIQLYIAGNNSNSYSEECWKYIKHKNLEKTVFMLGFMSDVSTILKECDCLLSASMSESFPLSMVEAATYDLTIISTPVAGVPEVFVNNYNAFISKDFSENEIYNSICECLESYKQGTINKIHENAHETWMNHFERNNIQRKISEYYKEIELDFNNRGKVRNQFFFETKSMYEMFQKVYEKYPIIKKRCLYHHLLKKELYDKEIYIWGAGLYGNMAYELLHAMYTNGIKIKSYVDRVKEGYVNEIPIIKPEEIFFDKNTVVLISFARNQENAIHYLQEKGLILNKEIWVIP